MPALGAGGRTVHRSPGPHPLVLLAARLALHRRAALWRRPFPQEFVALTRARSASIRERPGDSLDAQRALAADVRFVYASDLIDRAAAAPGTRRRDHGTRRSGGPLIRFVRADGPRWRGATRRAPCSRGQSVCSHAGDPRVRGAVSGDDVAGAPRRDRQPVAAEQVFPGQDAVG
jgi:hypothetical protein